VDLGLKGRRALVTAASKGLGRACAEALAAEGALVFIASRDPSGIAATAQEIGAAGQAVADVSREADVQALVEAAVKALGGLDILVVNAGGPPPGTFDSTDLPAWDVAYQLTLMSAVRLTKLALPHLKVSDQGRIVYVTSISVRQPIPNILLSNSLRSAVTGMAKTLSAELAPNGITVNMLAPDSILTDRVLSLHGGDMEEYARSLPMKRTGDPSEFGALCAFLCSKQAGYISGQTIGIDGGSLRGVH